MSHTPLSAFVRANPAPPLGRAREILEQVGLALDQLHRNGQVHGDVRPRRIELDPDGRATLAGPDVARSASAYAAPEVLRGQPPDARSDVFGLGAVAYVLLTGRRPFPGATEEARAQAVLEHEPRAPHRLRAAVPVPVSEAVMRCLAKSPADRTLSVAVFLGELAAAEAPGVSPRRVSLKDLALTLLAVLLLGALVWGFRKLPGPPEPVHETPPPHVTMTPKTLAPAERGAPKRETEQRLRTLGYVQ